MKRGEMKETTMVERLKRLAAQIEATGCVLAESEVPSRSKRDNSLAAWAAFDAELDALAARLADVERERNEARADAEWAEADRQRKNEVATSVVGRHAEARHRAEARIAELEAALRDLLAIMDADTHRRVAARESGKSADLIARPADEVFAEIDRINAVRALLSAAPAETGGER